MSYSIRESILISMLFFLSMKYSVVLGQEGSKSCIASGSSGCITNSEILPEFDLMSPDNALLSLINSLPETVIRPKVGDKLMATYLPTVVDSFGSDSYSIGIEVNPGQLMMPESYTAAEFRGVPTAGWKGTNDRVASIKKAKKWSRYQFSGAATKSTGDEDTSSRYGFGLTYVKDSGSNFETQFNYSDCIAGLSGIETSAIGNLWAQKTAELQAQDNDNAGPAAVEELVKNSDLVKQYKKNLNANTVKCLDSVAPWNRSVIGAGLAIYYGEAENSTDTEYETGYGLWLSSIWPQGENGQWSFGARITENQIQQVEENGGFSLVDSNRVGVRYTHNLLNSTDGKRSFRGYVEVAHIDEQLAEQSDSYSSALVGFEMQISSSLYFQGTIGDAFGSEIERSSNLNGQFKWSFTESSAD